MEKAIPDPRPPRRPRATTTMIPIRRSNTTLSIPKRHLLAISKAIKRTKSEETPDETRSMPPWAELLRLQQETMMATQGTTPRWEEDSQQELNPDTLTMALQTVHEQMEGSPTEAINILKNMHRHIEATIAVAMAATPQMRAEMLLSYKDAPQSRHSLTPIYNYAAYIGTIQNQPTILMLSIQSIVQCPTIQPIHTYDQNYKLAGLLPTIFTGKQTDSDRFLKKFKQWQLLNRDHIKIKQAYNRILMALNYIKGPKVDNWQEAQLTKLETDN
jgi:hypothetical protein